MKSLPILVMLLFVSVSPSLAGELFGTISEGNKPVNEGVKIEIAAGGNTYSAVTDKFGAYRIFVKEKGKCTMTVHYNDQKPTFGVASFDKSTRYDLVLTLKDGKYTLGRK
jgi:hypothetical protein